MLFTDVVESERTVRFLVKMSPEEREVLRTIAKERGVRVTTLIRQYIRQAVGKHKR